MHLYIHIHICSATAHTFVRCTKALVAVGRPWGPLSTLWLRVVSFGPFLAKEKERKGKNEREKGAKERERKKLPLRYSWVAVKL